MKEDAEEFERVVKKQREETGEGFSKRQDEVIERMRSGDDGEEQETRMTFLVDHQNGESRGEGPSHAMSACL